MYFFLDVSNFIVVLFVFILVSRFFFDILFFIFFCYLLIVFVFIVGDRVGSIILIWFGKFIRV